MTGEREADELQGKQKMKTKHTCTQKKKKKLRTMSFEKSVIYK